MPTDSGMKTKKRFPSQNLRLHHSVHPCFRPKTKVYLCLEGGDKQYFRGGGGIDPKSILVALGQFTLFA